MKFRLIMEIEYGGEVDERAVRFALAAFCNFAGGSGALAEGMPKAEVVSVAVGITRLDPPTTLAEADAAELEKLAAEQAEDDLPLIDTGDTGVQLDESDPPTIPEDYTHTCQQCYEDFHSSFKADRFCGDDCETEVGPADARARRGR